MADPELGLKLPLSRIVNSNSHVQVVDKHRRVICTVACCDDDDADTCHTISQHRAEIIVAALTADAEPIPVIPSVDYTQIPREYAGKWVLIRIDSQQVVSVGDDPQEATEGFNSESLAYVLTKVPTGWAEEDD